MCIHDFLHNLHDEELVQILSDVDSKLIECGASDSVDWSCCCSSSVDLTNEN